MSWFVCIWWSYSIRLAGAVAGCNGCRHADRRGVLPVATSQWGSHAMLTTHLAAKHTWCPVHPPAHPHALSRRSARLVANPGCYPTSVQLPLVPLLQAGLILPEDIIIDAKSGG